MALTPIVYEIVTRTVRSSVISSNATPLAPHKQGLDGGNANTIYGPGDVHDAGDAFSNTVGAPNHDGGTA